MFLSLPNPLNLIKWVSPNPKPSQHNPTMLGKILLLLLILLTYYNLLLTHFDITLQVTQFVFYVTAKLSEVICMVDAQAMELKGNELASRMFWLPGDHYQLLFSLYSVSLLM